LNAFLISGITIGLSMLFIYIGYYLLMRVRLKRGVDWNRGEIYPKTSLIVATYNEENTLPSKLKNVLELSYPKELLELVIIDSGSTDRTPEIVEDFKRQNPNMNIIFIREKERLGKTHALNIAYPKATGTLKIISDSDALLDKSALKKIVSNFNDETVGAACGRQILLNPNENASTRLEGSYRTIYNVLREGESISDSTPIFHGELSAYRACLIEPLPENKSADDSRMANIIRKKGFRTVYDSDAVFYEYAPPNSRARLIQKVRRGQGLIRVFWDFKDCMLRRKYGTYGMLILPVEFFIHCIFPALWLLSLGFFFTGLFMFSWPLFISSLVLIGCIYVLSKVKASNVFWKKLRDYASLFLSFSISQLYLFYASILWIFGRSLHKWQKVEDVRNITRANDGLKT
jgi:biofilm PGA synthesis N-glycosyltransferase PgaC